MAKMKNKLDKGHACKHEKLRLDLYWLYIGNNGWKSKVGFLEIRVRATRFIKSCFFMRVINKAVLTNMFG